MNKHLFRVGQMVDVMPYLGGTARAPDRTVRAPAPIDPAVQIVRLLPAADLCFRYLVRNQASGHERIIGETDLRHIVKAHVAPR